MILKILKIIISDVILASKCFLLFEKQLNQCAKLFNFYVDSELVRFLKSQNKKIQPYLMNKSYLMKKDGYPDEIILSLVKLAK